MHWRTVYTQSKLAKRDQYQFYRVITFIWPRMKTHGWKTGPQKHRKGKIARGGGRNKETNGTSQYAIDFPSISEITNDIRLGLLSFLQKSISPYFSNIIFIHSFNILGLYKLQNKNTQKSWKRSRVPYLRLNLKCIVCMHCASGLRFIRTELLNTKC